MCCLVRLFVTPAETVPQCLSKTHRQEVQINCYCTSLDILCVCTLLECSFFTPHATHKWLYFLLTSKNTATTSVYKNLFVIFFGISDILLCWKKKWIVFYKSFWRTSFGVTLVSFVQIILCQLLNIVSFMAKMFYFLLKYIAGSVLYHLYLRKWVESVLWHLSKYWFNSANTAFLSSGYVPWPALRRSKQSFTFSCLVFFSTLSWMNSPLFEPLFSVPTRTVAHDYLGVKKIKEEWSGWQGCGRGRGAVRAQEE